jgi:peptide/nickel transport system ATP-binding protein
MELLRIEHLHVSFPTEAGIVRAVDDVCLDMEEGDSLCLVGESGCGKSMVALSIIRLLPDTAVVDGEIRFRNENLFALSKREIRRRRGRNIAMIFEQPATCLNPVFTVGDQIAEAVKISRNCPEDETRKRVIELMDMVGIPSPDKRYAQYPHEFSGGMQQRAMIAMALAYNPVLLIADEPTTSLDATIQAQIIELLHSLIGQFQTTLFMITHDLAVASELCRNVAVMYAGEIVEKGRTREVFASPQHPYTRALLDAISENGLNPIAGSVPDLSNLPVGCKFHPRCPDAIEKCRQVKPEFNGRVRCHR